MTDVGEGSALAIYVDKDREKLRNMIALARGRLAELQSDYMAEKRSVDATNTILFDLVREHYQKRDRLNLIIEYRRKYLDKLLSEGEQEADAVVEDYEAAKSASDQDYEEASHANAEKKELSPQEQVEAKSIFKKLMRLFHVDLFQHDPEKQRIYGDLMAAINNAKEAGQISILREIADDPDAFIARQGWAAIDLGGEETAVTDLRRLYEAIEIEIVERIEALDLLRSSPEYELMGLCKSRPDMLDEVADHRITALQAEIVQIEAEALRLKNEIEYLVGSAAGPDHQSVHENEGRS